MPQKLLPLSACGFMYENNTDQEIPNDTVVCCGLLAGRTQECIAPGESGFAEGLSPAKYWTLYCDPGVPIDMKKGSPFVGGKGEQYVLLKDVEAGDECIEVCAQPNGSGVEQCAQAEIPEGTSLIQSVTLGGQTCVGPWDKATIGDSLQTALNDKGLYVTSVVWADGQLTIKGSDLGGVGEFNVEL